jgi:outer membrane biogenesis lipoprotein LolB
MRSRTIVLLAISVLLASCARQVKVNGNENGGMIDWFGSNENAVWQAAQKHCAQYGKSARVTSIPPSANQNALFECK